MNPNHLIYTPREEPTENVGSWNLTTVIWISGCKGAVNNAEKTCPRSYHYTVTNITVLRGLYTSSHPPSNSVWVLILLCLF